MKKYYAAISLMLISILGCEKQTDVTNPKTESQMVDGLIPMKAGYYWISLVAIMIPQVFRYLVIKLIL